MSKYALLICLGRNVIFRPALILPSEAACPPPPPAGVVGWSSPPQAATASASASSTGSATARRSRLVSRLVIVDPFSSVLDCWSVPGFRYSCARAGGWVGGGLVAAGGRRGQPASTAAAARRA